MTQVSLLHSISESTTVLLLLDSAQFFFVFCAHQSGYVSGAAIICATPNTVNNISNFVSFGGMEVSSATFSKSSINDTEYSVKVTYNFNNIWSPAFVICQSGWITDVF